jgi:ATP-dependent exoDNAse (exonuclease V) beta subunit
MTEIYDCAASVALSASAGSGKTHALTTRLLALLLSGTEILAVTFTKSAAQDIRRKLFDRVSALERGVPVGSGASDGRGASAGEGAPAGPGGSDRQAAERELFAGILGVGEGDIPAVAKRLRMKLVRQFSMLQISTIHGFFARLLHSFPRETGFFGDLAIIDERMKRKLVEGSFERFYEGLARDRELSGRILEFLTHFRERNLRAGSALRDVFESVGSRSYSLRGLLERMEDCRTLAEEHAQRREALASGAIDAEIGVVDEAVRRRLEVRGGNRNLSAFVRELRSFQHTRNIRKLAGLTPFARGDRDPVAYIEDVRDWLPPDEGEGFAGALAAIGRSVKDYLESEMRAYACVYLDVFNRVSGFYAEMKKNANAADFEDLELLALGFGAGLADFDYFGFRMGRIRHVLIDEFQDTSLLQWDALKPIVGHAVREGGSFFYVGDVKQSIYRWRGGDPTLFKRVAGEEHALQRSLDWNWRQNGLLLRFVNDLFEEIGRGVPEFKYERALMPPERAGPERGYVAVRQCADKDGTLAGVLESLRFLGKNGVSIDDCAILCRSNKELEEIETLLTGERVPFVSPGRSWLLADWAVRDLMELFRLAAAPGGEMNAAGLLRSPVVRAGYDDVQAFLDAEREGSGDARTLAGLVDELAERASWLTPAGFLRTVFESFGLLDLYPAKREVLLELYERAWVFEKTSRGLLPADFLEYLQESEAELTVKPGEGRGTRLLTVHKAKGLEFHSVVVPFLVEPLGLGMDGSLLVGGIEGGREVRTAFARSLYRDYFSRDDRYGPLFRDAELNARVDELNVLYVALTRARENLIALPRTRFRAGEDPPKTVGELLLNARAASRAHHIEEKPAPKLSRGKLFLEEAGRPVPSAEPGVVEKKVYRSPGNSRSSTRGPVSTVEKTSPHATESPRAARRKTESPKTAGQKIDGPKTADLPGPVRPGPEAPGMTDYGAAAAPPASGIEPAGALAWEEEEPDRGLPGGMRKRRVESLKGLLVHKALESMGELPADGGALRLLLGRAMARLGARYTRGERESALEKAERSLRNIFTDGRMAVYLSKGAAREVVFVSGGYGRGMGRIDRALFGKEIRVVDFKTNETGGAGRVRELVSLYRSQVTAYCDALARIFPGKTVKGALYFTDAPYEERFVAVYGGGP